MTFISLYEDFGMKVDETPEGAKNLSATGMFLTEYELLLAQKNLVNPIAFLYTRFSEGKKLSRKELKKLQKKADYEREILSMGGKVEGLELDSEKSESEFFKSTVLF